MCDLNELANKIVKSQTITIMGNDYKIKNCILATDGEILKVNAILSLNNYELELSTELINKIIPEN